MFRIRYFSKKIKIQTCIFYLFEQHEVISVVRVISCLDLITAPKSTVKPEIFANVLFSLISQVKNICEK